MTDDLVKRLDDLDPILETEFDTQIAIQRDPYGATKAIEKSLYLLRDQADRIEALTADFARQVQRTDEQREAYEQALSVMEAERDRLREAAIALRDDMMERAEFRMDTISGEQYRIVNAGNSAWMGFCAALKGDSQ